MTPRVADLDATLPSPRSLAASPRKGGPAGQPQPLSPAKRPQSPPQSPPQPLSPAARQVLPSPRREPRSLFGAWRQLSPAARKIFSWGRLPSDPAASAKRDVEEALHAVHAQQAENGELVPAAAAAGQGAHANGAAAAAAGGDGDERGQWHHVPSRSGRLNLQEEALFQPPDAVVLKAGLGGDVERAW